jgi:hypothetical protein
MPGASGPGIIDEQEYDGKPCRVFFAKEPYGVCCCFTQSLDRAGATEMGHADRGRSCFRNVGSTGRMGVAGGSGGETAAILRDVSAVDCTPGIIALQQG